MGQRELGYLVRGCFAFLSWCMAVLAILFVVACEAEGEGQAREPLVRLAPVRVDVPSGLRNPTRLIDGDMVSSVVIEGPVRARYMFDDLVSVEEVRIHGASGLRVSVRGDEKAIFELDAPGWERREVAPRETHVIEIDLEPMDGQGSLSELAVWGRRAGNDLSVSPMGWLSDSVWGRGRQTWVMEADVHGLLLDAHDRCGAMTFYVPEEVAVQARRAYLTYRGPGLHRPIVLQRSIGGRVFSGGMWLGGGAEERIALDELDPAVLESRTSAVLCLPDEVVESVPLRDLALLVLLDDGQMPLVHGAEWELALALDGRDATATALSAGVHRFELERPMRLDGGLVSVSGPDVHVSSLSVLAGLAWREVEKDLRWPAGRSEISLPDSPDEGVRGVGLELARLGRDGLPPANLSRFELYGDAVGPKEGVPRIVITYPRPCANGRLEHFGSRAYVAGFVAGTGVGLDTEVRVDGELLEGAPQIATALERSADEVGPWVVRLSAHLADGTEIQRVLVLDDDRSDEIGAGLDGERLAAGDEAFGAVDEIGMGTITPEQGGEVVLGSRVRLVAPPGAVSETTQVAIQRKAEVAVPPLDPGLVNVTAPDAGAYRFLPPGQRFERAVRIHLPYAPHLLPPGTPPEEVQTYYYDEQEDRWRPLARAEVDRTTGTVVSETTHFTFMVNAVLTLPDHPGVTAFDPNRIRNLEAADPSAGIDLVEPPEGNNLGTARLGLPIRLPPARGAYQPALSLAYDSDGGNGWLGVGWDLPVSSVQIDTRHGVPHFDGTERFLLDGAQLVPSGESAPSGTCGPGATGKLYNARVEGAFQRIVHCGADEKNRGGYWIVWEKDGTAFVYGHNGSARLSDPADGSRVAQWMLKRVVDANGNLTEFEYELDTLEHAAADPESEVARNHGEPFARLYLQAVRYTGHVDPNSPLDGPVHGNEGRYEVRFSHEPEERNDVIVSARTGFKTVTRRLLRDIEVVFTPDDLVRRYRLSYTEGDFGRALLARLEVFGAADLGDEPPLFHAHDFDYYRSMPEPVETRDLPVLQGGDLKVDVLPIFKRVEHAHLEPGHEDRRPLGRQREHNIFGEVSAGVSLATTKSLGAAGHTLGAAGSLSRSDTVLLDLTGNGLPDRIGKTGLLMNQGGSEMKGLEVIRGPLFFSSEAGIGDPAEGMSLSHDFDDLGRDRSLSISGGLEIHIPGFALGLGGSYARGWTRSMLMDFDGDGLVDIIDRKGIRRQLPRREDCAPGDPGCCPVGRLCLGSFDPGMGVAGAGELLEDDDELSELEERTRDDMHLTDAVLQWTAPYSGRVALSVEVERLVGIDLEAGEDGATITVIHVDDDGSQVNLAELAPTEAGQIETLDVERMVDAGDRIVLHKTTIDDVGVRDDGTLADQLLVRPAILYLEVCDEDPCRALFSGDLELSDPMGGSLYLFDGAADLRLAGGPPPAFRMGDKGKVSIDGLVRRNAPSPDAARACIQRFTKDDTDYQRPCADNDLLLVELGPDEMDEVETATVLGVEQGDALVFRLESDLPIDPADLSWDIDLVVVERCLPDLGEMTEEDEEPPLTCEVTTEVERTYLTFAPEVFAATMTSPTEAGVPLVPLVVPSIEEILEDLELPEEVTIIEASSEAELEVGFRGRWGLFGPMTPVHVGIVGEREQHFKARLTPLEHSAGHSMMVTGGETLTFVGASWLRVKDFERWPDVLLPRYDLSVSMMIDLVVEIELPDGQVVETSTTIWHPLDPTAHLYLNRPGKVPFGGGYRGWWYGEWNGNEDYDEARLLESLIDPDAYGDDPEENQGELVASFLTEGSNERESVRLWWPMVARRHPQEAGVSPTEVRLAWTGFDGNAFIERYTDNGEPVALLMHAARRTGRRTEESGAAGEGSGEEEVSDLLSAGPGEMHEALRLSTDIAASVGATLAILSGNLGLGRSTQKSVLMDMDGDGIPDRVAGGEAILTDRRSLSPSETGAVPLVQEMKSGTRRAHKVTLSAGLGINPLHVLLGRRDRDSRMSPGSKTDRVGFSIGGGVGSASYITQIDLIDINGDGLPDAVSRVDDEDEPYLLVWLNLGGRFASEPDRYPVTSWPRGLPGELFEQIELTGGGLVSKINDLRSKLKLDDRLEDDEEAVGLGILDELLGLLGKLSSADVLERSTSATLSVSVGGGGSTAFTEFGASAAAETSLSSTRVALRDLTGNGLPDYVRQAPGGGGFVVQLNLGDRFSKPMLFQAEPWSGEARPIFQITDELRDLLGAQESDVLQYIINTLPATAPVQRVLQTLERLGLTAVGLDAIEVTGTTTLVPRLSAYGTVYIGLPWPFIYVGAAGGYSQQIGGLQVRMMDMTGDGFADQVLKTFGTQDALHVRINALGQSPSNVLREVRRPLGGRIELGYTRIGNTVKMPQSRWVMTEVLVSDGERTTDLSSLAAADLTLEEEDVGHVFLTRYGYEDGRWDRNERELLGFARVLRQNPDGSLLDQRFHNESYEMRGLLASETLMDAEGAVFVETVNEYEPRAEHAALAQCTYALPYRLAESTACESTFPMLTKIEQRYYEGGGALGITTTQTFGYDQAGNVTSFDHVLGEAGGESLHENLHATIVYTSTAGSAGLRSKHIVGLPTSVTVDDGNGRRLRSRSAVYDDRGNLETFSADIGSGETATTTLQWTDRGNLRLIIGPPNASGQPYAVEYEYDNEVHTYVTEARDSHELISSAEYDYRFGEPTLHVDANGNRKKRELDAFGRLEAVWGPYDIGGEVPTIAMRYRPGNDEGWAPVPPVFPLGGGSGSSSDPAPLFPYAVTEHKRPLSEESTAGGGTLDTLVYIDGLGRVRQTQKHAEVLRGGQSRLGWSVSGQLRFDEMGRVAEQGQVTFRPGTGVAYVHAEPVNATIFQHDVLGRTTRTVLPDGATTSVEYGFGSPAGGGPTRFMATVTDARGNLRVVYRDPEERIVAVEERLTAGPSGGSNEVPGWAAAVLTTRYKYNATGELERITDAGGNVTSMTYDLLGRRLSLENPDAGLTEYRYDLAGNLVMRLDANMRAGGGSLAGGGT